MGDGVPAFLWVLVVVISSCWYPSAFGHVAEVLPSGATHVVADGRAATGPEYLTRPLRRSDARGRARGARLMRAIH